MLLSTRQLALPISDRPILGSGNELPLGVDRWLAASAVQKSIRRGDLLLASQAAATLYRLTGSAIWRRLVIIAFEDIGVGSEGALKFAVLAAEQHARGNDARGERAAVYLARKLAILPKDRTADHLVSIGSHHPSLASTRLRLHRASPRERVSVLLDRSLPVPVRATAALMLATKEIGMARRFSSGGLNELMSAYRSMGAPARLIETTDRSARTTREVITIFAPLIREAAFANGRPAVNEVATPPARIVSGIPTYLVDKHVALGKTAIGRLVAENRQVQAVLAAFVPRKQWLVAAATAAFHADAAPVARSLVWPGSEELARLGAEGDLCRDGARLDGAQPLIECVRANLDHLNEIRVRLLTSRLDRS